MMSVSEQRKIVSSMNVPSGTSKRVDCPFCGGRKTLSITNKDGMVVWNCFKASCDASGAFARERSLSELRTVISAEHPPYISKLYKDSFLKDSYEKNTLRKNLKDSESRGVSFVLPEHFVPVLNNELCVKVLSRYHSLEAVKSKLVKSFYDPRDNRLVFCVEQDGSIIDATGRALTTNTKPKWRRYGNSDAPLSVGTSDTAVIVEDAFSACAVSFLATGVALMGTRLSASFLAPLRAYKKLVIALDPDATAKALAMHRVLSYVGNTEVVQLPDDLKYYGQDEIARIIGPHIR